MIFAHTLQSKTFLIRNILFSVKMKIFYLRYITFFLDMTTKAIIINSDVKEHDNNEYIFFATNITSDLLVSIAIRIKI